MNIALKDVNYQERYVLFETDTGEQFKASFEYIQDINRYVTKEWNYDEYHRSNEEVSKQQNLEYGLDESGMSVGTEYDE